MKIENQSYSEEEYKRIIQWMNPNKVRDRSLKHYSTLFGIEISDLARTVINRDGNFTWYDICCGWFYAGWQLRETLQKDNEESLTKINLTGVDFDMNPYRNKGIKILNKNAVTFLPPKQTNLLTCLFGLLYIQKFTNKGEESILNWYNRVNVGSIIAFDYPTNMQESNFLNKLSENLGDALVYERRKYRSDNVLAVVITKSQKSKLKLDK